MWEWNGGEKVWKEAASAGRRETLRERSPWERRGCPCEWEGGRESVARGSAASHPHGAQKQEKRAKKESG
jgi:hypothetical protein